MENLMYSTSTSSAVTNINDEDDLNIEVSGNVVFESSPNVKDDTFETMFNLDGGCGIASSISTNNNSMSNHHDFTNEISEENYNIDDLNINISIVARSTFNKIINQLGPVLTCKYFCTNLLKMLAICYMNDKCLSNIDDQGSVEERGFVGD
jgi:hypothetical protein